MSQSWQDKIALITGASSGIGAATARLLAQKGMRVVLAARRLEQLEREINALGGHAYPIQADLTQESDRTNLLRESTERVGEVDILINNAGFCWYGYGTDMTWKTALDMLQVNIEAVVQLSLTFLRGMRRDNSGHIINIGSISGSIPSQGIALYGATKSFLDNFTTALHRELAGTRVHISVVRAGPVLTEFGEAALARENGGHVPTEKVGMSAEKVAGRIWGLIQHPRRLIYVPDYLRIVPWLELSFGWIIDRVGPLLLEKQEAMPNEKDAGIFLRAKKQNRPSNRHAYGGG